MVWLACQKPREVGYPHELWTTRLLARHVRENAEAAGHACLTRLAQGSVCKILDQRDVQPHKVRYYLERRDEAFEQKMAEVLCVYREVAILRATEGAEPNVAIKISGACTLSREPYPFNDIWDPLARIFDAWGLDRCLWGTDWTRAFAVVNYEQAVEPFKKTDRLNDSDRAMLMGGACAKAYNWSPK